jgi:DNA polymerase III subunit epsilon
LKLDADELERMAALLEASGDYRVLRRLRPGQTISEPRSEATLLGIFLDVETTGLDHGSDEVIELAMVPFRFTREGRLCEVLEPFVRLREPSIPIAPEVTALTGITDEMVRGHTIDPAEVYAFVAPAVLVVAHHAAFDRRFAERLCDVFRTKAWACSMADVPWADEGFDSTKLRYIAAEHGIFFDGHRAEHDCHAALEVLARPLPRSGVTALSRLLEAARRPRWRVWAVNAPYELRHLLKRRGYRWQGDEQIGPYRAWFADLGRDVVDAELRYLCDAIYGCEVELPVQRITAYDRYSERC